MFVSEIEAMLRDTRYARLRVILETPHGSFEIDFKPGRLGMAVASDSVAAPGADDLTVLTSHKAVIQVRPDQQPGFPVFTVTQVQ